MPSRSLDDREREAQAALAREPGDYSWKRASSRMGVSLGIIGLFLLAAGFGIAEGGPIALVISLLVIAGLLLLLRETDGGRLDATSYLKGYRGERMVADLLGMLEPLGFRHIPGLEFTDERGRKGNIDHTVIGPTGVFAIETKNWNGRMWKADEERLIHNGVDETGAVLQALAEAKELRRRLEAGRVPLRWVEAVLVSAKSTLPDVRVEFRYVTLVGASDLVPFIRDRPRVLSESEIASAENAVSQDRPTRRRGRAGFV